MEAAAQGQVVLARAGEVLLGGAALDVAEGVGRRGHVRKREERAVACRIDEAPLVLGDGRLHEVEVTLLHGAPGHVPEAAKVLDRLDHVGEAQGEGPAEAPLENGRQLVLHTHHLLEGEDLRIELHRFSGQSIDFARSCPGDLPLRKGRARETLPTCAPMSCSRSPSA